MLEDLILKIFRRVGIMLIIMIGMIVFFGIISLVEMIP